MKLKVVAAALALVGCVTSVAVAKGPPPARGPSAGAIPTKVRVCHATGSARQPFRPLAVSRAALEAHMRHGDLLAPGGGGCPVRTGAGTSPTAVSTTP